MPGCDTCGRAFLCCFRTVFVLFSYCFLLFRTVFMLKLMGLIGHSRLGAISDGCVATARGQTKPD